MRCDWLGVNRLDESTIMSGVPITRGRLRKPSVSPIQSMFGATGCASGMQLCACSTKPGSWRVLELCAAAISVRCRRHVERLRASHTRAWLLLPTTSDPRARVGQG